MKEIILIKNGELALKGLNRSTFESVLMKNIRKSLRPLGEFSLHKAQSAIVVELKDGVDMEAAAEKISKVFGIAAYSRAGVVEKEIGAILDFAPLYLKEPLLAAKTFKVEGKRADKAFPLKSPEICAAVGERILETYPHLNVDVHHPDITVTVEVRDVAAYVRAGQLPGAGGMPVSTGGRAAILISGGIDSPVAAWMMAKRGIELTAIHFASPPYTSARAEMKVKELLGFVSEYAGKIPFAVINFTEIQEEIAKNCPDELSTLIMRRFMMRIAELVARRNKCSALITGESVGQVASQTLPALVVTDNATDLPVFRPVIGMDKEEIVSIARKIGTFETSILPYEDCCTVFTPKHPRTRPKLSAVIEAEQALDCDALIMRAMESLRFEAIE